MLSLLFALALQSAAEVPKSRPSAAEAEEIMKPIRAMFAAFETGDAAAVMRYSYPEGRVTANGVLPGHEGLREQSFAQFAAGMTRDGGWKESITDADVRADGDIAMVWAPFLVRVKGKVSNCGIDHFDLVRDHGDWKVMNVTFSSRMTGCPAN